MSEIRDIVKEVMEEPEMQRLLIEAVHAATIPKKDEPCTLANLGLLSTLEREARLLTLVEGSRHPVYTVEPDEPNPIGLRRQERKNLQAES